MQRVNEYRFYELGVKLERLRSLTAETTLKDCFVHCWEARVSLERLLNDPVSLKVCRPAATKVIEAITSFLPEDISKAIEALQENKKVGPSALTINSSLDELDAVLEAECQTLDTYAVSQKGAYSTSDLIENAEIMLPEPTRKRLGDSVVSDLREAGRCLAFDSPTAAGFHMLRAVESVMASLWKKTVKPGGTKPQNWNAYIKQLEAAKVDKKITDMLDSVRSLYRNPVNHPEAVLSDDDATVLFGLGTAAIQEMAQRLGEGNKP